MITLEPTEDRIKISGEPKSLGKAIYHILTKPCCKKEKKTKK